MVKNKTTIRFLALIAFLLPVLHLAFYFGTQEQLRALFIETMIQWGEFFLKHFNLWVYLWLLEGIALIAIGVNLLRQRKKSTGFSLLMASLLGASYLVTIILQLSSPPELFIFPALIIFFTFGITIYLLATSVRAYPDFIKKNPLFKANFRHKASGDMSFKDSVGQYKGTVSNLSINGGFFMAKKVIALDQVFDFTVPLGEASINFTATVVRISMDEGRLLNGFGVKITKISKADKAKLKAYLISNPHILN